MKDLSAKQAVQNLTASEFKKNNGLVFRAANLAQPLGGWFTSKNLQDVLGIRVSSEDISKSIVYLTDEGYFKVRHQARRTEVDIADHDIDDLEFRRSAKGTRLAEYVISDDLVEV